MTKIESSNTELSIVRDNEPVAFPTPVAITQVDPDFLIIFQPHVLIGDLSAFAQQPDVAAISQTVATQIFGQENPLGKILQFRLQPTIAQQQSGEQTALQQVRIIAVVAIDNPRSQIRPAIFFPRLHNPPMPTDQGAFMREVYVKAKNKLDSSYMEALLNKASEASLSADEQENKYSPVKYSLMSIAERHMNDNTSGGNRTRVIVLSLLGIVILVVAIGNFISLGLAGYVARQKEVALRRMQGAGIWQLLSQYWLENLVYVATAFLLALIICELYIPYLAGLLQFPLVGGIFAGLIFVTSVISIPMIMDRQVDAISAGLTSIRASLQNPGVMLLWGGLITVVIGLSMLPAFLGLLVSGPVIGHATWHAYRHIVPRPA